MSLFNLSPAVLSLSAHSATVTRYGADTYNSQGRGTRGATTTFSITCSFQPISGRDKVLLPEGIRPSETVSVWTPAALQLRDRIVVTSRGTFEVIHVDLWQDYGNYYKVIAKRLDDSEPMP